MPRKLITPLLILAAPTLGTASVRSGMARLATIGREFASPLQAHSGDELDGEQVTCYR